MIKRHLIPELSIPTLIVHLPDKIIMESLLHAKRKYAAVLGESNPHLEEALRVGGQNTETY